MRLIVPTSALWKNPHRSSDKAIIANFGEVSLDYAASDSFPQDL